MDIISTLDHWIPIKLLLYFAFLLNPFSQVIFLLGPMKEFPTKEFASIYWKATLLSFGIYLFFGFLGEWVLPNLFQVRISSLKIFGGLIILYVSFRYLLQGAGSNTLFKIEKSELAHHIALPYIVGPATIWVCILIGRSSHTLTGMFGVGLLLILNWSVVIGLGKVLQMMKQQSSTLFGKYLGILMRTNSLFIGAIGVEMIVSGILELIGRQ